VDSDLTLDSGIVFDSDFALPLLTGVEPSQKLAAFVAFALEVELFTGDPVPGSSFFADLTFAVLALAVDFVKASNPNVVQILGYVHAYVQFPDLYVVMCCVVHY